MTRHVTNKYQIVVIWVFFTIWITPELRTLFQNALQRPSTPYDAPQRSRERSNLGDVLVHRRAL
jgi:hypothetical protein